VFNLSKVLPVLSPGIPLPEDKGTAIASPFRRLDAEKLAAAKADLMKKEAECIIRRSSCHGASPLHLVKKPDGFWRLCINFWPLNGINILDTFSLPNMMDFSATLDSKMFKIDLRKGYFQILKNPDDIPKTAIITILLSLSSCTFLLDSGMQGVPFSR